MLGHIEWRGKNKDHARLMVTIGINSDGQAVKKYKSIGKVSSKEAEKALASFITEIENGTYVEVKKTTLSTFSDTWLSNYADLALRPKTVFRYRQILSSRILPELGHLQISKITPLLITAFYRKLQTTDIRMDGKAGGLSMQTILHHHRLLHAIFETAVKWGVLANNPISRVNTPKVPKKEASCYDANELKLMFHYLQQEYFQFQVIVTMAIETGMRESELMGLLWSHINLDKGTAKVEQTRHYIPKLGHVINPPKTELSRRVISLSNTLVALLRELKEVQDEKGYDTTNTGLFKGKEGSPLHATTMSSWFPRFIKRHGLKPLTFHGLRHTSATLLNTMGLDISSISKRLGHSTKVTTLNIYTHAFASSDIVASSLMDKLLIKSMNPTLSTSILSHACPTELN